MKSILVLRSFTLLLLGAFVFAFAGCDDGMSSQDAFARCEIEKENSPTVLADSYQQCVTCFEACGDRCKAQGKTPEEYLCDE